MDRSAFGWIHGDRRQVWYAHDCIDGLAIKRLPYPEYEAIRQRDGSWWISRSVHCGVCQFDNEVKIITR